MFQISRTNVVQHIKDIYEEGELDENSTCRNLRSWATERLKEYMIKGFTVDAERLKNLGGGNCWKELLDRIRDIRSSKVVMYR